MAKYYKFYLSPGQQPPEGTTSRAMPDGGIVWIGEKWIATDIEAHEMSQAELDEYHDALEYEKAETEFHISFEDFRDKDKLTAVKDDIISKLDAEISKRTVSKIGP